MIFLRISSKSEEKINKIVELLLKEKLAINLNIKRGVDRVVDYKKDQVVTVPICVLTGKTKGLLFPLIEKRIEKEFSDEMPEIFSLPIIHMDWNQSIQLSQDLMPV